MNSPSPVAPFPPGVVVRAAPVWRRPFQSSIFQVTPRIQTLVSAPRRRSGARGKEIWGSYGEEGGDPSRDGEGEDAGEDADGGKVQFAALASNSSPLLLPSVLSSPGSWLRISDRLTCVRTPPHFTGPNGFLTKRFHDFFLHPDLQVRAAIPCTHGFWVRSGLHGARAHTHEHKSMESKEGCGEAGGRGHRMAGGGDSLLHSLAPLLNSCFGAATVRRPRQRGSFWTAPLHCACVRL